MYVLSALKFPEYFWSNIPGYLYSMVLQCRQILSYCPQLTTHFHAKVSLLDGLTQYSSYNHGWPENRFIMSIKKNVAI